MSLADRVDPLVLNLLEEIAAIELDCLLESFSVARRGDELVDVEPRDRALILGDGIRLYDQPAFRRLGQDARKVVDARA